MGTMLKNRHLENLKAHRAGLEAAIRELQAAQKKLPTFDAQSENLRAEFDRLNDSGASDNATVRRLREISDSLERLETVRSEVECASVPRLEANLWAKCEIVSQDYAIVMTKRINAFERRAVASITPLYCDKTRAAEVAARSDGIVYLRAHLSGLSRARHSGADAVSYAGWLRDRIAFAIDHDGVPWGSDKPPLLSATRQPEPERLPA